MAHSDLELAIRSNQHEPSSPEIKEEPRYLLLLDSSSLLASAASARRETVLLPRARMACVFGFGARMG